MTSTKGGAENKIPHTRLEDEEMIWETYEIGKKLGQGSFGKVYQVRHKETDEQWAMKFVNKEKAGSSAIKLLEREVAILKRVSHKNIIKLNEVFETAKRMYLVMELCEGGELADALKEKKYFMESEVKVITKELASAISYLHKSDIVHRDIKLENILISKFPDATNPEDRLQIKVTDFGLSITKSGVGHDNLLQDFCGTPNYMAPEIIDNKTYSQQCDVWALGVIVYTLFCGYPPFREKEDESLYDIIKKGELDFSDDIWDHVSEEAKTCIRKMLNTDPAHRLTASEVLDHHWITGDQERQGGNVLELMKEWGKDLKIDSENSAINGELEDPKEGTSENTVSAENHSEETNNNVPKEHDKSKEESSEHKYTGRKDSGGKKPGSGGGQASSRLHPHANPGSSSKSSNVNTKPSGAKSPMPATTKGGQSGTTSTRPNTQNPSRTVNSHRLAPTTTKSSLQTRPITKGSQAKK